MRRNRTFLVVNTSLLFLVGGIASLYVFISSLNPHGSADSLVEMHVRTDDIEVGDFKTIEWLGDPIAFYRESETTVFGYVLVSTYRSCYLEHVPPGEIFGESWKGGWADFCNLGAWDYRGKVVAGVNSGAIELDDLEIPQQLIYKDSKVLLTKSEGI